MNEEQVDVLIAELVKTRESFSEAIGHIKWNRRNTAFQYVLIVVLSLVIASNIFYYRNEQHRACERGNDLRLSITRSLDANALAIGIALSKVTDAPQSKLDEYLRVYNAQAKPEVLKLRKC